MFALVRLLRELLVAVVPSARSCLSRNVGNSGHRALEPLNSCPLIAGPARSTGINSHFYLTIIYLDSSNIKRGDKATPIKKIRYRNDILQPQNSVPSIYCVPSWVFSRKYPNLRFTFSHKSPKEIVGQFFINIF